MGLRDDYKKMCDAPCGDCAKLNTCAALDCTKFKSWVSEQGWQKKLRTQDQGETVLVKDEA